MNLKNAKNFRKLVGSAGALCAAVAVANVNVGAWFWSKKSKKPERPVVESKDSIEKVEAHKAYVDAESKTQAQYEEYQKKEVEYRRIHAKTSEAYEKYQKSTAVWSEKVSDRDKARSNYDVDCNADGSAYDEWALASQKERAARLDKENDYVEWVKCRGEEKKAYDAKEKAYKDYIAALINQKAVYNTWVKVCDGDAAKSK